MTWSIIARIKTACIFELRLAMTNFANIAWFIICSQKAAFLSQLKKLLTSPHPKMREKVKKSQIIRRAKLLLTFLIKQGSSDVGCFFFSDFLVWEQVGILAFSKATGNYR